MEGYDDAPNPSVKVLPIADQVPRNIEVQLMSLMYKNNLMNHFLWNLSKVESPLCHKCKDDLETPEHIIFYCKKLDQDIQASNAHHYKKANDIEEVTAVDPYIGILNASREEGFINNCVGLLQTCNLRETIIL